MPKAEVYSIGYANDTFEPFLARVLALPEISHLVDIRTNPYSRYQEDFRGETFAHRVDATGLKYIFMGDRLGGKPTNETVLTEGEMDPLKLMEWPFFQAGIERIIAAQESGKTLCMMCGCGNPIHCHRGSVLSEVLLERGVDVLHAMVSGDLVPHSIARRDLPPRQMNLFT
ncbi:MAG: DUF488 domain-containing protein [Chthonomonas sp.]|nr:DUF488 domain-containing protein [Chthonomonas sp.]